MSGVAGRSGGVRPGSGRKPTAEKYKVPIGKAEAQIAAELPQLLQNLLTLAKGVHVEMSDSEGAAFVYQKPPDYKANEYLINRIMGKPTERQEIEADVAGAVLIGADLGAAVSRIYANAPTTSDESTN